MTQRVLKYEVPIENEFVIRLNKEASVLKFEEQRGKFYVWALVNQQAPEWEDREFQLAATGYPIRDNMRFVGTAFLHDKDLVFHLFEKYPENTVTFSGAAAETISLPILRPGQSVHIMNKSNVAV